MLEYDDALLLLIAAREGEQGLKDSVAEGRGVGKFLHLATDRFVHTLLALTELVEEESHETVKQILQELSVLDVEVFPSGPLMGEWI